MHRQHGHYPWRDDCRVCVEAAVRSEPHRRQMLHAGVLAVDIAALSGTGPYVLVGATQAPGYTYAEPARSRAANDLRAPLLRMVLAARERGEVRAVHVDREHGAAALESDLLGIGVALRTTQGRDPQPNGMAEQAVGQLGRMARAVLGHYPPEPARGLWQHAMLWAAERLADPKIPPFGAKALIWHAPAAKLGKLSHRAAPGV